MDVTLLRKGPEDLPKSLLLLAMAVAFIIAAELLFYSIVDPAEDTTLLFATELVKVGSYVAVLFVSGFIGRLAQTMTAILGCTAVIVLLFVVVFALSRSLFGEALTIHLVWLMVTWLILVEGHIISRSIQQHWFTGIAIAIVIFVLQLSFYQTFRPEGAPS